MVYPIENEDQNYNQEAVSPPIIPATTPTVNPEAAPVTPTTTPSIVRTKPTVDEQVQKFYATREPAPIFDQEKADRIQRMGNINEVGQGVKVLGDIFGSALGANTRRRQPDTTAPALYQNYQAMMDKYEAEKQAYNYRGFQKNLQDAQLGIQRADKETAQEFANRRQTAIENANAIKAKQEENKTIFNQNAKTIELGQNASRNKETSTHNRADEGIRAGQLAVDQQKANAVKNINPIELQDKYGKNIIYSQGDWDKMYQGAMADAEFRKIEDSKINDYKLLPDGGRKDVVSDYNNYIKNKEYVISQNAAENKYREEHSATPTSSTPAHKVQPKTIGSSSIYSF